MKFKGKTAVVTGAGSGIGQAIAIALADRNCNLALVDINERGLEETKALLSEKDVQNLSIHVTDLSNRTQIGRLAKEIFEVHKEVSALFNIAGVAVGGQFLDIEDQALEKVMQVNFFSQVYLMKEFLPHLKTLKEAHIVNMSSLTGVSPFAKQTIYSASKHAVRGFSHALAYELDETNVAITVAYPGAVSTNIVKNAIVGEQYQDVDKHSTIEKGMPAKEAAEIIIKAAEKGKRDVIVGQDAKLVVFIQKLFPISYWNIIKKYVDL